MIYPDNVVVGFVDVICNWCNKKSSTELKPGKAEENYMKRLNLYVPSNMKIPKQFIDELTPFLHKQYDPEIEVHIIENAEIAVVNEVGFDIDKWVKFGIGQSFIERLEDA